MISEQIEKRTFRQALVVAVLLGISNGGLSLNNLVALEVLEGIRHKEAISTLAPALPSVAMFFSMIFNGGGVVRRRRKYWLLAGAGGYLVYSVAALFVYAPVDVAPFLFVGLIGFSALINSGVPPAQNQLWGANFRQVKRARLFSYFWAVFWLVQMATAIAAGIFMDSEFAGDSKGNFQILYPAVAVVGFAAMLMMYRIRLRYTPATQTGDAIGDSIPVRFGRAVRRSFSLLKTDRNFRVYEVGFFFYGMAFMVLLPLPALIYSEAYLNRDYTEFATATSAIVTGSLVIGSLMVGRLVKGRRVTVVTGLSFVMLLLYPAMLGLLVETENLVMGYVAFFLFGLAMSGVHFSWNLGPVTFAKGGNAIGHSTTHTMMVGMRAVLAFPVAYIMLTVFGGDLTPIFVVAAVLMSIAIGLMMYLDRDMRRQGLNQTT
ncbi:MAG: MFS transporter [Planctomycetota bacterium]